MSDLNRDQLRVVVCFAGIFGLFFQLVAETVFGASVGAGLTGTFGTLATLPVVDGAVERYTAKRDPGGPPDGPTPPGGGGSTPTPTPTRLRQPAQPPDDSEIRLRAVAA